MAKRTSKPNTQATVGSRARLIAVGGAKGGVGKSVFATNLAVCLSSRGHRTVVVDLDLGGANQHLYLGHRSLLPSTINDFVKGRVRTLEEVTVETRFGPRLIGGNSSELGSANLAHARKMKLLRAIRSIDADYVVLDLGGDTSYNIVDCFNLADLGVVVTTRESASYIGAYQFIKVALYRKLQRAFAPESRFAGARDERLEALLLGMTSSNGAQPRSVDDLLKDVRREAPESLPCLLEILDDFRPYLVTNRLPRGFVAAPLVANLRGVMRRWLSKEVGHLGSLTAEREVEASALELVPAVFRHPNGRFATELRAIADRLLAERPSRDAGRAAQAQEDGEAGDAATNEKGARDAVGADVEGIGSAGSVQAPRALRVGMSLGGLCDTAANDLPPRVEAATDLPAGCDETPQA